MDEQLVYTVKETVSKMAEQNAHMEARQIKMDVTLEQILEQTKKTNGQVERNRENISLLKSEHARWKAIYNTITIIIGSAWAVLTFMWR